MIFAAFFLLAGVILVSTIFSPNKKSVSRHFNLDEYAKDLFECSVFPTAVLSLDLKLVGANKAFYGKFKYRENFNILEEQCFFDSIDLREFLENIRNRKLSPVRPYFFLTSTGTDKQDEDYVILRTLNCSKSDRKMLVLIMVSQEHTQSITKNLIEKIAAKESDLKKLEEVDHLKSEFLATLSHELKTPLVSIKGYLDLMASEKMGPLTEKQTKALKVSLRNTSHLNSVISSMLNFARMEAGKLLFDLTHQKLQPHLNDISDSLRPMADNKQISLKLEYDKDLPMVVIDAELIHRVLINLIDNAIKFSTTGTEVKIVANQVSNNLVKVSVIDKGKGIPENKLGLIKTPFFQVDKSDTRTTAGIGLGLAIAEKILIGHGTTLCIDSKPESGTTVSFYLKVAPPRI